ncbi:MAG: cache domain-containing protein, partial [Halopseudomonas sp.]
MHLLRRFSISQRLFAVISLTLLIIVALVAGFAVDFRQSLLDGRALKTQHLVESGMGVLQHYHDRQLSGELSEEQAKAGAMVALSGQRYGDNDYFWVHTLDLQMLMHPFSAAL